MSVTNGVTAGAPLPCDVTNATVTLVTPDPATGSPLTAGATTYILASNASFPADGSGNIGPISRTFVVPAGPLAYGSATAQASITGSVLHDFNEVEDSADISKTSSAAIADANIQITPSATNRVGTNHTFTGHVNTSRPAARLRQRARRDGDQLHDRLRPGQPSPAPALHHGRRHRLLHGHAQLGRDRRHDGLSAHTTLSVGGVSLTRNTDGDGRQQRRRDEDLGRTRRSRSRPTRRTRCGQPHTFTVTLIEGPRRGAGFVAAAGRARRLSR